MNSSQGARFRQSSRCIREIQEEFTRVLPRIWRHAQIVFRHVRCSQTKDECIAEVIALCWAWWLRLRQRDRQPSMFVSALATFAARAVRCGRRFCEQERANEVFSRSVQQRHSFSVRFLATASRSDGRQHAGFEECLQPNTQTPVPDQTAFRLDFRRWLKYYDGRKRRLINRMMQGETTKRLAKIFGLSPARISQSRREFFEDWADFQKESL